MAKKASKKSGSANRIAVIEEVASDDFAESNHEANGAEVVETKPAKAPRAAKAKPPVAEGGGFAVSDIKKAAAFANSVGGLDKAIAVLQILKVAKEVQ